jgi:hypothetical protein
MDLTDATTAEVLQWLGLRDVRSDNAGRRAPETRRSRQPKRLDAAGVRTIFAQGQMRSAPVIVAKITTQDAP